MEKAFATWLQKPFCNFAPERRSGGLTARKRDIKECVTKVSYHGRNEKKIILIAVTAVLLVGAIWVEKNCNLATWQLLIVYLIPYLIIGHETLMEAAEGITHGEVFDEDFLMAIATIGALCIGFFPDSETEFPEAVFVMLFFQVGELFEGYAEGKSRDSISHLMDIRPDVANVERKALSRRFRLKR